MTKLIILTPPLLRTVLVPATLWSSPQPNPLVGYLSNPDLSGVYYIRLLFTREGDFPYPGAQLPELILTPPSPPPHPHLIFVKSLVAVYATPKDLDSNFLC